MISIPIKNLATERHLVIGTIQYLTRSSLIVNDIWFNIKFEESNAERTSINGQIPRH